jgi:hypothetical protein
MHGLVGQGVGVGMRAGFEVACTGVLPVLGCGGLEVGVEIFPTSALRREGRLANKNTSVSNKVIIVNPHPILCLGPG